LTEDKLAIRPPVLEGEYIDPETAAAYERYGLIGGAMVLMQRRLERQIMREFLTGQAQVPGADISLPIIDVPRRNSRLRIGR
jgi:hypothetical protein